MLISNKNTVPLFTILTLSTNKNNWKVELIAARIAIHQQWANSVTVNLAKNMGEDVKASFDCLKLLR